MELILRRAKELYEESKHWAYVCDRENGPSPDDCEFTFRMLWRMAWAAARVESKDPMGQMMGRNE